MEWTTIKSAKQINLEGVSVEVDRSDSTINSITITDAKGNKLRVRNTSYSVSIDVPATPKTVDKFSVTGTIRGIEVNETFDTKYAADNRKSELESGLYEDADLKIAKTAVEEEIPF